MNKFNHWFIILFCILFLSTFVNAGKKQSLIYPENFSYMGAFKLPGNEGRDQSFSYGGYAMTYASLNDGSLYIMGHPRLAYGEFDNGNQVAQVTIPKLIQSKDVSQLKTASFLQNFVNIRGNLFKPYAEIPQVGMAYLDIPQTGKKIHVCWGQHFHESPEEKVSTHAWFNPDLSSSNIQGGWLIGSRSYYSTNAYLFEIEKEFADQYLGGRYLATGRFRDGGWSGMGPVIFAYAPWQSGNPPAAGTRLKEKVLLLYQSSKTHANIGNNMNNYQHADDWAGGAWLSSASKRSAVVFAGTKGTGSKYWYGWRNPKGELYPCVETAFVNQFVTCRNDDGSPCPKNDLNGCANHDDSRGWWSSKFNAAIIFYDPDELAKVALGEKRPSAPQSYATLYIDEFLILQQGIEEAMLGKGNQRISRIGSIAYDREKHRLFVLEPFADGTKPIIHVFRIK
ncbi:MAG: hypothetical protein GY699_13815 [Desulfobacteraceae bacterium]|nr:hypothetical protein [Desulfobacteraceae bacterium]